MLIRCHGRYFSAGADLKGDGGGALPTTGSGIREMHRRLPTRMRQIWDEMEAIEKAVCRRASGTLCRRQSGNVALVRFPAGGSKC